MDDDSLCAKQRFVYKYTVQFSAVDPYIFDPDRGKADQDPDPTLDPAPTKKIPTFF